MTFWAYSSTFIIQFNKTFHNKSIMSHPIYLYYNHFNNYTITLTSLKVLTTCTFINNPLIVRNDMVKHACRK